MPPDRRIVAEAAHHDRWRTFEVVFGVSIPIAIALQLFVPWSLHAARLTPVLVSIGIVLLVSGTTLVARARRSLRAHGQPTDPGRPTLELVTTGAFAFSRNPLYLGGIAILLGLSLVLDLPWLIVLLVPSIVACHYLLIVPEERYLMDRFGEEYSAYAEKVGRWMGRAH